MHNRAAKKLLGFIGILFVLMLALPCAHAAGAFGCSLDIGRIAEGYCAVRVSLDRVNTTAVSVSFTVTAPGDLTVFAVHSRITDLGGSYTMSAGSGSITYQFNPNLSYNPTIRVGNVRVTYADGQVEDAGGASLIVPLHAVHEHQLQFDRTKTGATCLTKVTEIWRCGCGVEEERETSESGPHNPDSGWTRERAANCLSDGSRERDCTQCGTLVESETIFAPGSHQEPDDWRVLSGPTCVKNGQRAKACLVCSETLIQEAIPATGVHEAAAAWTEEKAATCTTTGLETLRCQACDEVLESRDKIVLKHTPRQAWDEMESPGCEKEGLESLLCTVCETILESRALAALGHTGKWIEIAPASCSQAGEEHLACSRCEATLKQTVSALGHDF